MKALKVFIIAFAIIILSGFMFILGRASARTTTDSSGNNIRDGLSQVSEEFSETAGSVKASLLGRSGSAKSTATGKTSDSSKSSSGTSAKSTSKKTRKANPITKAIVSEAIDSYAEQAGGDAKNIADSMSAEDKEAVTEIIASNVSLDSISDIQSAAASGDMDALMDYAEKNFSEEDIAELKEIMSKYTNN